MVGGVAYLWPRCIIMAKKRRCIIAGITVLVHCTMYNYVIETNLDTPACAVYLNKCSVCWVKKYFYHPQSTVHLQLSLTRSYPTRAKESLTPSESSLPYHITFPCKDSRISTNAKTRVLHPLKPQQSLFNVITICAGKTAALTLSGGFIWRDGT